MASRMTSAVGYLVAKCVQPVTGAKRKKKKMDAAGAKMKTKTGAVIADRLQNGTEAVIANVRAAAMRSARNKSGRIKGICDSTGLSHVP